MILSCNSCGKKFVVPDNAIGPSGRLVQCSSCGNKWKQFPTKKEVNVKKVTIKKTPAKKPSQKIKKKAKKRTGPDLYSPEYLAKKHGIRLNDSTNSQRTKTTKKGDRVTFGFYNYLIVIIVVSTFLLKLLYFNQGFVTSIFPMLEIYLDYLFESIINIKEIILDFLFRY